MTPVRSGLRFEGEFWPSCREPYGLCIKIENLKKECHRVKMTENSVGTLYSCIGTNFFLTKVNFNFKNIITRKERTTLYRFIYYGSTLLFFSIN